MNKRNTAIVLAGTLCLASLWAVLAQRRQLTGLRAEQRRVLAQLAPATEETVAPNQTDGLNSADESARAPTAVSSELLRLRAEVNRLITRKRELAGAASESETLQARLASRATNASDGTPLPPGYMRKAQAQWVGCATPEDTIQSFLWTLQHHDFTNFLRTLNPNAAQMLQTQLQQSGQAPDIFFKNADVLPGMAIRGREQLSDGTVQLQIEIGPGMPAEKVKLQLINGEWKLTMPF